MSRFAVVFIVVAAIGCSENPAPLTEPTEPALAALRKASADPITGITGNVGQGPYYYFKNGGTTPQGIGRKVCMASDIGNWAAHIEAPASWTGRDCGAWVYQHMTRRPTARQSLGCVFDNGFSYGVW